MSNKLFAIAVSGCVLAGFTASQADAALVFTSGGLTASENFNSMSGTTVPTGWQVGGGTTVTTASGSYNTGAAYKFTGAAGDFAVGVLNSSGFASPKTVTATLTNSTGSTITALSLNWNYEKYRSGSREWVWSFSGGAFGAQTYAADGGNTTYGTPISSASKSGNITGLSIANGATYTLTWTLTGTGGSSNGQALGLDDFSATATLAAAANDTVLSLPASPIAFGRVKQNASGVTRSLAITEAAGGSSTSANFTTSVSGSGPAVTGIGAGSVSTNGGSASQTLTLNTTATGAISRTISLANGSNTSDTTGAKSVSVTGNVVADRSISTTSVNFGKVLRNAAVSGTTSISTLGTQADASYTRVTLDGAAQGAQGVASLATGGGDNTFGTGSASVDRTLQAVFTSGSGAQNGSYSVGLADEFSDSRTAAVDYNAEVYDLGTPSFSELSEVTLGGTSTLELEQGGIQQVTVPVYNLAGVDATYTLGLNYYDAAIGLADPITISGFSGVLAAGQSGQVVFNIDTSSLAIGSSFSYEVTLLVTNEDQGVAGVNTSTGRSLTYTLGGTVVPEPTSLALLSLGGLLIGRRRRA